VRWVPIRDENGILVLEFGTGDILVNTTKPDEEAKYDTGLAFMPQEPHEIGAPRPEMAGKRIDEIPVRVHMTFSRVESVDVVIEALQVVRRGLIAALEGGSADG